MIGLGVGIGIMMSSSGQIAAFFETEYKRLRRNIKGAFEEGAKELIKDIKQHIEDEDLSLKPLSPATIARKKRNPDALPDYWHKPWVESGAFRESLTYWWEGYGQGRPEIKKSLAVGVPEDAFKRLHNGDVVFLSDYILANEMRRPLMHLSVEKFIADNKIDKIIQKKLNEN